MKKIKIKLNARPVWELGKGHNEHRSGSGIHDNRPKRQRTRQAQKRRALDDYQSYLILRIWLEWLQSAKLDNVLKQCRMVQKGEIMRFIGYPFVWVMGAFLKGMETIVGVWSFFRRYDDMRSKGYMLMKNDKGEDFWVGYGD